MFTISKEFMFSASHQLKGLPEGHPCGKVHGHNYVVKVELKSKTLQSETGFVRDYGELKPISIWIDSLLDHRHLNDVMLENPTAENNAKFIYDSWKDKFPELSAIEVSETPKTNARYEP